MRGASDEQLERRFGNQLAQRVIFAGMARQFDPRFAFGFEGDIRFRAPVAEEMKPQELLFSGRFDVEGDYQVASRLSEMFGGPSQT